MSIPWGFRSRVMAAGVAALLGATVLALPAHAATFGRTTAQEAKRVDRVTPRASLFDCSVVVSYLQRADCGTITLPLDYDQPRGATVDVAVVRVRARNQKTKIGTLFLNPGGPGGSGTGLAADAPFFLDPTLTSRFDIVGFDPRGTGLSTQAKCWPNFAASQAALEPVAELAFPWTSAEKTQYITTMAAASKACSRTGNPLTASMSTAQVARDMEVMRRYFGDKGLNYLGFSYGSQLGQVYANLYPDRVRSMVIDGVINPIAWTTGGTLGKTMPSTARLRSGEASYLAVRQALAMCRKAGPAECPLAAKGDPQTEYDKVMGQLRRGPLTVVDPDTNVAVEIAQYNEVISLLEFMLELPAAPQLVPFLVNLLIEIQQGQLADAGPELSEAAAAADSLRQQFNQRASVKQARAADVTALRKAFGVGFARGAEAFPYDNSFDAFSSVLCTDGINPSRTVDWRTYAAEADKRAPGFGPLWTWASAQCASRNWTTVDEDRYLGSFARPTANPVLIVGSYHDPATPYSGARKAARLLPNSRLLSSDNWGHTAYGTSDCVTTLVTRYLVTKRLPVEGKVCRQDMEMMSLDDLLTGTGPVAGSRRLAQSAKPLPATMKSAFLR